ncbi:hypothetical protein GW17_00049787, partial [Ensete ventricosum]
MRGLWSWILARVEEEEAGAAKSGKGWLQLLAIVGQGCGRGGYGCDRDFSGACLVDALLGTEWELVRMSGDSELGLEGRLLEWWSPGEEGVIQFGSAANSCK